MPGAERRSRRPREVVARGTRDDRRRRVHQRMTGSGDKLRVAFIHPDLGIGGAERLIVDAAVGLREAGHAVTLFTTRYDPARALAEIRDAQLPVRVYGRFLPAHVLHHLRAPCAVARMHYLAARVALAGESFDVIVCDLVAHVIPFLRLLTRTKVVFYCHYPDRLLAPPGTYAYAAYRFPLDRLEAHGTRRADYILTNSEFTAAELRRTVPALPASACEVLYPGVDCSAHDALEAGPVPPTLEPQLGAWPNPATALEVLQGSDPVLLCLSRYDRGKNLDLAIDALAVLRRDPAFDRVRLVMAGGYDVAVRDNEETFRRLVDRVRAHRLGDHVIFLRSITDRQRLWLLGRCRCVVYTPVHEHFGLVPVEAMAARRPVVAVAGGGVRETVVNGQTGFLCAPQAAAFAHAVRRILEDPALASSMGVRARDHVEQRFSRRRFTAHFEAVLLAVMRSVPKERAGSPLATRTHGAGKDEA